MTLSTFLLLLPFRSIPPLPFSCFLTAHIGGRWTPCDLHLVQSSPYIFFTPTLAINSSISSRLGLNATPLSHFADLHFAHRLGLGLSVSHSWPQRLHCGIFLVTQAIASPPLSHWDIFGNQLQLSLTWLRLLLAFKRFLKTPLQTCVSCPSR